ncbi:MAG: hypothetical protein ACR2H1_08655, partial [Limisphaerales bacterium]
PYIAKGLVTVGATVLNNITKIAAGNEFSLALTQNGKVISWGRNRNALPLDAASAQLQNVVAIAAGQEFGLAITTSEVNPNAK